MIQSPLTDQYLGELRKKVYDHWKIAHVTEKLGAIYAHEISKVLPTKEYTVETSMGEQAKIVAPVAPVIVPVLRAGDLLAQELYKAFLDSSKGPLALTRDHATFMPIEQYSKVPNVEGKIVIGVEPMIATGGSAAHLGEMLIDKGAERVILASVVSAPEGLEKVINTKGISHVYLLAQDSGLDKNKYIIGPGYGDAGQKNTNTSF